MKNKTKKILCAIIFMAVVSIALVLVLNTEQFRTSQLEKQLSGKYGVKFSLGADEQEQSFFSLTHCYMLTSDEGIRAYAKCDWKGKLISDSYAHFYYADEMTHHLNSLIGSCFDGCFLVRDCIEYGSNLCQTEFVSIKDSESFEAYCRRKPEVTVTYRAYVDIYVSAEEIQNALDILSQQEEDFSVYFLRLSPIEYELINDTGLNCYYPNSGVYEVYQKEYTERYPYRFINVLESLIYEPFDFTVAEYVPKYNFVKIYDTFHERNREYFVNVDKERTHDEIVADIGYENEVKGSGIFTYIWKLCDGKKAQVVFDSSQHIEFITIRDDENDSFELIYDRYPAE